MRNNTAAKQMSLMDIETEPFSVRMQSKIWEMGLNTNKISKMTGLDYANLAKVFNHPEKFEFTEGQLSKLAELPFLRDMIASERLTRMSREHAPTELFKAFQDMIKRDENLRLQCKAALQNMLDIL